MPAMPSMLKSLKLISDPTRLRILMLVENEGLSVAELQEVLGMGQSRISTQLGLLKNAGLVQARRSSRVATTKVSARANHVQTGRESYSPPNK